MYFLVILAFLGLITGCTKSHEFEGSLSDPTSVCGYIPGLGDGFPCVWPKCETFFHHHENRNFTLSCSKPGANEENKTVWCETDELLQIFHEINCTTKSRVMTKQRGSTTCTDQLSIPASPGGGVFACAPRTNTGTSQTCPLFTNMDHCRQRNFFIVAIKNTTAESEMFEKTCAKSHADRSVQEKSNITLSCEFTMKINGQPIIIYWIKNAETSKCLSCVTGTSDTSHFSYNERCCVDEMIKGRLLTSASRVSNMTHVHNITILNVTYSDSGIYLCVVNSWYKGKQVWKIASNLSIEVRNQTISSSAFVALYATTGMILGIIIIGGIAWLIYKKKIKSKGNPSAQLPRSQDAIEIPGDECSPYAMCSSKDMQRNEVSYLLATRPDEDPNAVYSMVDNTTASGMGPGD